MKYVLLFVCFLLVTSKSQAQGYGSMGTFNSQGVPNYLVQTNDVIPPNLLASISASLPESFPVPIYNPSYISNSTTTNIYMQSAGHVWVTFVDEGAGYKNVLGYYSYPIGSPPSSVPSNGNLKVIFPNVSKVNSGGGLVPGNKVYLGHFNAGSVISWFLLADGFKNGAVTNGNWRLFSNPAFNPESNPVLRHHNVLLYDSVYHKIILGFEDIRRDYGSCDNDFNDAIFYVTATPDTAISLTGINFAVNPTPSISSGNNGGLESDGSLAELIARRNFKSQHIGRNDMKEMQQKVNVLDRKTRGFDELIPDLSSLGFSKYISTPEDLIGLTNAKEIVSYDYYDSLEQRQAVVLYTKTESKVYNHSKSICDRLKKATLREIEEKDYSGVKFITYTLQQSNGEFEYVTCFSVSNEVDHFELYNQWLLGDFPQKVEYFNYQVWSAFPHLTQYIVEDMLKLMKERKPLIIDSMLKKTPKVYFTNGFVSDNTMHLSLENKLNVTQASIKVNYTNSEKASRYEMAFPVKLEPYQTNYIQIPFDHFFDADIHFVLNDSIIDEMYLADGAWGVDYLPVSSQMNQFDIQNSKTLKPDLGYSVQRGAIVNALTNEYFTLYKMFNASNMPCNLNKYEFINLEIKSKNNNMLCLSKKSVGSWEKQPKYHLIGDDSTRKVSIPLSLFKTNSGETVTMEDLMSISFTQKANNNNWIDVSLDVKNVSFSKSALFEVQKEIHTLKVYPNPISMSGTLSVDFVHESNTKITLSLISTLGNTDYTCEFIANEGVNQHIFTLPGSIKTGVYIVQLKSSQKVQRTTISIQ